MRNLWLYNTKCHFWAFVSLSFTVSLVSTVPHLLVIQNNTGSNATGTDVFPQPGAPLEVWCWTEVDEIYYLPYPETVSHCAMGQCNGSSMMQHVILSRLILRTTDLRIMCV